MEADRSLELANTILTDVVRRRTNGEIVLDDAVLAEHPELSEHLRIGLARLHMIDSAHQKAHKLNAANTLSFSPHTTTHTARNGLAIRCPHCQERSEVDFNTPLAEISCDSCGKRFNLVGTAGEMRDAAALASVAHFDLVECIGIGGFGTVWKARDKKLDRVVAVKIPRRSSFDVTDVEKFLREARAAGQLNHPHIVSVHEVGREGDLVFIVSDFVRGMTLERWLSQQRPTIRQAVSVCVFVAEALHHAHEQGVIHRDLKPGNIIIAMDGRPRVMDFGMARREVGEVTMTIDGQLLGTPAYMSPEQALGKGHAADRRTDIYSLGVILFELLTGERPFRGEYAQLLFQVVHDAPPGPRMLNSGISKDLHTIVLKCLAKEPQYRYQTAQELADELRRFLSSKPILARPSGPAERLWRWTKREPLLAAIVSFVVVLLILSLSISIALLRSRHALQNALTSAHQHAEVAKQQSYLAERQTVIAQQRTEEAQRQQQQANDALAKLNSEIEKRRSEELARKKAEEDQQAAAARGKALQQELDKQSENLQKQEAALTDAARGRQTAEANESKAIAQRDELARQNAWSNYIENLTAADKLLSMAAHEDAVAKLEACPKELRSWEWYYLNALAHGLVLHTLSLPQISVDSLDQVAIADDASSIVVKNDLLGLCQIYGTAPFQLLYEFKPRNEGYSPFRVVVSPDGTRAYHDLVPRRGQSNLWDLTSGKRISLDYARRYGYSAPLFSSDGELILFTTSDIYSRSRRGTRLVISSARTGEELTDVALRVDGPLDYFQKFVVGCKDLIGVLGMVRSEDKSKADSVKLWLFQWNLQSDAEVIPQVTLAVGFKNDRSRVKVRFSANDKRLLVAEETGYTIFDTATGTIIGNFGAIGQNRAIAVSPDNRRILSIDSSGLVLRDIETSKSLPRLRNLPWSDWLCQLGAEESSLLTNDAGWNRVPVCIFAINPTWSQCVGISRSSTPPTNAKDRKRSIYVWRSDTPILPAN